MFQFPRSFAINYHEFYNIKKNQCLYSSRDQESKIQHVVSTASLAGLREFLLLLLVEVLVLAGSLWCF